MKISRAWLQKYFETPLPAAQDLADALTFHAFEIESVQKYGSQTAVDWILDVKVTANRGHDCLSHRGIARELSAILQLPLTGDPLRSEIKLAPKTDAVDVAIEESDLCARYCAGMIRGVRVAPSPAWLRDALESIGQRSINNVVDATNYVMFDLGQPLHAFDAGRLVERDGRYAIAVRRAKDGERMIALDEKEYELSSSMLVVSDAHAKTAIGIAGVKGGSPAAISEETSDIIVESANFNGASVRKTAAALRLRTDASTRFEQVISPELAVIGMHAVARLILEVAGGELVGFNDLYIEKPAPLRTSVTISQINTTLGASYDAETISDVFTRLGLACEANGEAFTVTPPFERLDITSAEDLIEEVGRIAGYDRIEARELAPLLERPIVNANFYWQESAREFLVERGFSEVYTPVFAEKGDRVVLNKVDGVKPYLRTNLTDGLKEALVRNVRLKELLGTRQVRIFEIGTIWKGGTEETDAEIAVEAVKGMPSEDELRAELRAFLQGLDPMPSSYQHLPASGAERYQPFSRFPFIVRDIAMWIEDSDEARGAVLHIFGASSQGLLRHVNLFDQFKKDGKTSLAFRMVFQSFEQTLTDESVNAIMAEIQRAIEAKGWQVR